MLHLSFIAKKFSIGAGIVTTLLATSAYAAPRCDRACLEGKVDAYLAAMVSHDPKAVPTISKAKYTENTMALIPGDGLWATISALGSYKNYFADVEAGQVGFFGTIRENDEPAAIALRLKVVDGRVAEAETLVLRDKERAEMLEKRGAPAEAFHETIPVSERASRQALAAAANSYFDGLTKGAPVSFTDDCNRVENGAQTTNNPERKASSFATADFNPYALSCDANMKTAIWRYIQRVEPRRFLIIDPERGNVFGMFMFIHPGTIKTVNSPTRGIVPMPKVALRPFNVQIGELFNVNKGSIRAIEAVEIPVPYGSHDGW